MLMVALVVLASTRLVQQYFQYQFVSIILSFSSSTLSVFSHRYSESFSVSSFINIFSYFALFFFGKGLLACLGLGFVSFGGCWMMLIGCGGSALLRSLELQGCKSRDSKELMEIDCLFLESLYCLQVLFWLLRMADSREAMEGMGFTSGASKQVLLSLSLFLIILPMLFLLVRLILSASFSLFSLSRFQRCSRILRSVSLKEQGSVLISCTSMTFVLDGQQTGTSRMEVDASLPADCFSGRLFLPVFFIGVFFADLGFCFGSEVMVFLAEGGLSECMTIQNFIFLELLAFSSTATATFCGRSAPMRTVRDAFPHLSLRMASTLSPCRCYFSVPSLPSSLYCCNSFIIFSSHISSFPRVGSRWGGTSSDAAYFSAGGLLSFLKRWFCCLECQFSWERNELYLMEIINKDNKQYLLPSSLTYPTITHSPCLPSLPLSQLMIIIMQELRGQNKKLKELQRSCEEELQKLKEVGRTHENQIDTLLKFNERLLGIIENQFNTATKNKISSDLQIISEINEGNADFNPNNNLANKLPVPPQIRGNFQQQDLEGLEDDDEEEEIYNKEASSPPPIVQPEPVPVALPPAAPARATRLDRVYEMQHRDEEVSINLSNSLKTNNPSESLRNHQHQEEPSADLQQLKDMVKEYREQFVDNSAQYEQICAIIHNDLLSDLQEFHRIQEESTHFYQSKVAEINSLRGEIRRFKPISELVRVMRKVGVPAATERLLSQKIISKHT